MCASKYDIVVTKRPISRGRKISYHMEL